LAPNLQVAQVDAHEWAISARGFNSTTANKLLVLIDGRSVYTPLFSGVFWDVQDTLMEDVDRIRTHRRIPVTFAEDLDTMTPICNIGFPSVSDRILFGD